MTNINNLTRRLYDAFLLVPEGQIVLDIGADRGLLAKALCEKEKKVYASENKKGPYEALLQNTIIERKNNLQCIFTDGIDILPEDVTMLSLLGMGGKTIFEILSRHHEKLEQIEYILIEPQSETDLPISFLNQNGYENVQGKYVLETRYYPLLLWKRTCESIQLTRDEIQFGPYPLNSKDELLYEHLKNEEKRVLSFPENVQLEKKDQLLLIRKGLSHYE